jgi:hypothetical protein
MSDTKTPAQIAYEAWVRSKESPPTTTPGEIAYTAYCAGLTWRLPWAQVAARQQQRWEAAAEAVRSAYKAEMAAAWQYGVLLWQEETPHDHIGGGGCAHHPCP